MIRRKPTANNTTAANVTQPDRRSDATEVDTRLYNPQPAAEGDVRDGLNHPRDKRARASNPSSDRDGPCSSRSSSSETSGSDVGGAKQNVTSSTRPSAATTASSSGGKRTPVSTPRLPQTR